MIIKLLIEHFISEEKENDSVNIWMLNKEEKYKVLTVQKQLLKGLDYRFYIANIL